MNFSFLGWFSILILGSKLHGWRILKLKTKRFVIIRLPAGGVDFRWEKLHSGQNGIDGFKVLVEVRIVGGFPCVTKLIIILAIVCHRAPCLTIKGKIACSICRLASNG